MTILFERPEVLDQISLDRDAVIEASAGTGKTYTLEHLIIEIMLRGGDDENPRIPVEEILVVTFTERATAELKARVRGVLEKIVTTPPIDPEAEFDESSHWVIDDEALRFLERQLYAFDRAPIHTIHGFCHRILSENAFNLRKLFDQEHTDGNQLFERAFKRGLRERFAHDPDLEPYLAVWLERRDLALLQKELSTVTNTTARITPTYHEEKLANGLRAIRTAGVEHILDQLDDWLDAYMDPVSRQQKTAEIGRLLDAMLEHVSDENDAWVIRSLDALHEDQLVEWIRWARRSGVARGVPLLSSVFGNMVLPRAAILQRFAPVMREVLDEEKAHGLFDFDDMLEMVWEVMSDATNPNARALLRFLRQRFRYALIDEFQDTDPTQWNIFKRLFYESEDHRIYVIGDPKQAIYGFRGADIYTYLDARETVLDGAQEDPVFLKDNYRSSQALIGAYNTVFDQEAERPFFSHDRIRYDEPVDCGLEGLAAFEADGSHAIPIELVRIVPTGGELNADALKRSQADAIAREARRILQLEPMRVIDRDASERNVDPKKVFVLTRTKHEESIIAEFMRRHGVPHAFYKREGLFQTREAQYILELLIAIDHPYWLANRLKAWATPFFEVPLQRLPFCRDLPETHPLFEELVTWHEMASRRDFEQLFNDILDSSGIVRREIFLKESERELTNYQHIFEVLQEEAARQNLDLDELIMRLRGFIDDSRFPETEEDKNVQRLESEREAVQIMTMHKSKGLEADVVFLFGGFSSPPSSAFKTLHWGERRLLHIGEPYLDEAREAAKRESTFEDERLLYVAVTRARYRVYLPYLERDDYSRLDHTYQRLNDRLRELVSSGVAESHPGFRVREEPQITDEPEVFQPPDGGAIATWSPGDAFDAIGDDLATHYENLRKAPLVVSSYSRMKAARGGYKSPVEVEEFMADVDTEAPEWRSEDDLPGGTGPGILVHTIIEELDFEPLRSGTNYDTWVDDPEIEKLFLHLMRRHGIDEKYLESAQRMVYGALVQPVALPDGSTIEAGIVAAERELREMEFLFPIPEASHPRLDQMLEGPFEIERGFIKGYIDFLFEYDGKVYFADWKTDSLESFAAEHLEDHVARNYATQARLYSLAVLKHFGITSEEEYDTRFGGYAYFFLRGPAQFIRKMPWNELVEYEAELVGAEFV